jgi:hypothetical protein
MQNFVQQRGLTLADFGEIGTIREESALANNKVALVLERNSVRCGELDDAFGRLCENSKGRSATRMIFSGSVSNLDRLACGHRKRP